MKQKDSYTKNSQTITIKFPNLTQYTEKRIKAISILLGYYNLYGRSIPLEEFKEMEKEFDELLYKMEEYLEE